MDYYEFTQKIIKRERAIDRLHNQAPHAMTLYRVDNTEHIDYGEGQKVLQKVKTKFKKMNMGISREKADKKCPRKEK